MTVHKGQQWGSISDAPSDLVVCEDDAALAALIAARRSTGEPLPPVALRGGSLARTLGAPAWRDSDHVVRMRVDVIEVADADEPVATVAVAHVVGRRSWWRGRIVALMNAQYVGRWDVSPRSHPGDGRAEQVSVAAGMGVRDRWRASRRLPSGTHVPHPAIEVRSVRSATIALDPGSWVWVDGARWRKARALQVSVTPDAVEICVPIYRAPDGRLDPR